jgi:hypothetical protein
MPLLRFVARQWLAIVLIGAILLSAVVTVQKANNVASDARDVAALVREKAIEVCADTSGAAALVVAFKHQVGVNADKRGEHDAAQVYYGLARGGADLIPMPLASRDQRQKLSEVTRKGDHYVLTRNARDLILRGCIEAYSATAQAPKQNRRHGVN